MNDNALILAQSAQLVRFDAVRFGFMGGFGSAAFATGYGALPPDDLAEKLGARLGVVFIGRRKNDSVAQVQSEDFRLLGSERRNE